MGKKWRIAHRPNSQRRGKTPKLLFIISAPPPPPPQQQQQRPLIHSVYICSLLWIRTQQQPPHTHTKGEFVMWESRECSLLAQSERKVFPAHKELHHTSSIVVPVAARRCVCAWLLLAKWRKRVRARAQRREGRAALAKVNALHAIQP